MFTLYNTSLWLQFLQRVRTACSATAVIATGVSVRPSVTFRCFIETNEATIMRFSLSGSKIILVSGELKIVGKFAGDQPERGKMSVTEVVDAEN